LRHNSPQLQCFACSASSNPDADAPIDAANVPCPALKPTNNMTVAAAQRPRIVFHVVRLLVPTTSHSSRRIARRNGRALHALILISEALSVKGGEIVVVEHGDPAATWSRSNRSILSQFTEKSCLIGTPWA
jgi:hypothetical protein